MKSEASRFGGDGICNIRYSISGLSVVASCDVYKINCNYNNEIKFVKNDTSRKIVNNYNSDLKQSNLLKQHNTGFVKTKIETTVSFVDPTKIPAGTEGLILGYASNGKCNINFIINGRYLIKEMNVSDLIFIGETLD